MQGILRLYSYLVGPRFIVVRAVYGIARNAFTMLLFLGVTTKARIVNSLRNTTIIKIIEQGKRILSTRMIMMTMMVMMVMIILSTMMICARQR